MSEGPAASRAVDIVRRKRRAVPGEGQGRGESILDAWLLIEDSASGEPKAVALGLGSGTRRGARRGSARS